MVKEGGVVVGLSVFNAMFGADGQRGVQGRISCELEILLPAIVGHPSDSRFATSALDHFWPLPTSHSR